MFARPSFLTRKKLTRLIFGGFLLLGVVSFICNQISGDSNHHSLVSWPRFGSRTSSFEYLNRLGAVQPQQEAEKKALRASSSLQQALSNVLPDFDNKGKRPKACFVSLVRNKEVDGMIHSIKFIRHRFNDEFKYPWVFLNDEEFTDEFKEKITESLPGIEVKFGLIPDEQWSLPEYVDIVKAAESRKKMHTVYGDSVSYRYMCRYQSGYFFRHPLLDEYDWYWRVEPYINICCNIPYDVFQWMQDNEKVYGFVISIEEYPATIPTLWSTAMEFFYQYPEYVSENNALDFISNDGVSYNNCHFWSNFEIGNLNFFRSDAYKAYFDYLDKAGGFFYERWGDAPVHTIALAMMLPKDKLHYFPDIGYYHPPRFNCPIDRDLYMERLCTCPQRSDVTFRRGSCGTRWYDFMGLPKPELWKHMREIDIRELREARMKKKPGLMGNGGVEERPVDLSKLSAADRKFYEEDQMLLGKAPIQVQRDREERPSPERVCSAALSSTFFFRVPTLLEPRMIPPLPGCRGNSKCLYIRVTLVAHILVVLPRITDRFMRWEAFNVLESCSLKSLPGFFALL